MSENEEDYSMSEEVSVEFLRRLPSSQEEELKEEIRHMKFENIHLV